MVTKRLSVAMLRRALYVLFTLSRNLDSVEYEYVRGGYDDGMQIRAKFVEVEASFFFAFFLQHCVNGVISGLTGCSGSHYLFFFFMPTLSLRASDFDHVLG